MNFRLSKFSHHLLNDVTKQTSTSLTFAHLQNFTQFVLTKKIRINFCIYPFFWGEKAFLFSSKVLGSELPEGNEKLTVTLPTSFKEQNSEKNGSFEDLLHGFVAPGMTKKKHPNDPKKSREKHWIREDNSARKKTWDEGYDEDKTANWNYDE